MAELGTNFCDILRPFYDQKIVTCHITASYCVKIHFDSEEEFFSLEFYLFSISKRPLHVFALSLVAAQFCKMNVEPAVNTVTVKYRTENDDTNMSNTALTNFLLCRKYNGGQLFGAAASRGRQADQFHAYQQPPRRGPAPLSSPRSQENLPQVYTYGNLPIF